MGPKKVGTVAAVLLFLLVSSMPGVAQVAPASILEIDVENLVNYLGDISDVSTFAADPGIPTRKTVRNFAPVMVLGDIVAVNGHPAKGAFVFHSRQVNLRTSPIPGEAIADIGRLNVNQQTFEILNSDGTPLGSIMASGLGGGSAPPGAPLAITQGNNAIIGGTGAFLGVRGQAGQGAAGVTSRQTSMAEDPANRRRFGGGRTRFILHVIPMSPPQIVTTAGGPGIAHTSDFSLVTEAKPAAAGEPLSLFVTGLGPTRPAVDPGAPFPSSPQAAVIAPIQVTVNGRPADVLGAVGIPDRTDTYQVNIRVPAGTASGTARVQLSAAWIAGPVVTIPIE